MRVIINKALDYKINYVLKLNSAFGGQNTAFVLKKYDYIHSVMPQTIEVFRDYKPRFLDSESVLPNEYYMFEQSNEEMCKRLFNHNHDDFYNPVKGNRFTGITRTWESGSRYVPIVVDKPSGYYIKGIRKELPAFSDNLTLEFSIKYTYEGFLAYDIVS